MLKLIIFDFDGLLVNSEYVIFDALKELFKRYKKNLSWDYFKLYIGIPVADALKNYHKDFMLSISYRQFVKERNSIVQQYFRTKLRLMPGVKKLLNMLAKQPVSLAIATSGKRVYISDSLKKFKIERFFKTVVCVEDVKRGKPNPDLIIETLRKTRVSPEESIIIEDSLKGIEAAQRAKIRSIAVPTRDVSKIGFRKATFIRNSIQNLYPLLKRLMSNSRIYTSL